MFGILFASKLPESLFPDNVRTARDGIAFEAVKLSISLSLQIKLVKFGKDVIFTEPLSLGELVPQSIE